MKNQRQKAKNFKSISKRLCADMADLEEKTGGAKGFLDFVFHLVSLPYSLQMSIHSIHSIHSISEKRENHEKPKTES